MRTRNNRPGSLRSDGGSADCGCTTTVHVGRVDTANFYNCPPDAQVETRPTTQHDDDCRDELGRALGACIPLVPGAKHKQAMQTKLQPLLENTAYPSALGAAALQMVGRYISEQPPGSNLETGVFEILDDVIGERGSDVLACALENLHRLPVEDRDRLFSRPVLDVPDALSPDFIAAHLMAEIEARAADALFHDVGCVEERPGLPRVGPDENQAPDVDTGERDEGLFPRICRVNGLRTGSYRPE